MPSIGKYTLICVAGFILAACSARQDPVSTEQTGPAEVELMASVVETKGSYVTGLNLFDEVSGTHLPMFVSASARTSSSASIIMATGVKFTRKSTAPYNYKPATPLYWPFSSSMDFLAYSGFTSAPVSNPVVAWRPVPSQGVSFTFTNTKTADSDILWAARTMVEYSGSAPMMEFSHAMAVLEVEINAPAAAAGRLTVTKIEARTGSEKVRCAGVFTVDNTYVVPVGKWSDLAVGTANGILWSGSVAFSTTGAGSIIETPAGPAKTGANVPFARIFIPQQQRQQLVLTYSIDGGAAQEYVVNIPAGLWASNNLYRYQLTVPVTWFP